MLRLKRWDGAHTSSPSVSNPEVCPPSSNAGWLPLHSSTVPSIRGKGQVQSPSLLLNWLCFSARFPAPAVIAAAPLWFVSGMIFLKRSSLWTLGGCTEFWVFFFFREACMLIQIPFMKIIKKKKRKSHHFEYAESWRLKYPAFSRYAATLREPYNDWIELNWIKPNLNLNHIIPTYTPLQKWRQLNFFKVQMKKIKKKTPPVCFSVPGDRQGWLWYTVVWY